MIFLNKFNEDKIFELFNTNSSFEYEFTSSSEDETKSLGKEFAKYIKIFDLLNLEDYYKTDLHWKQEKCSCY